jgi:Ca-activated chloride channel family protein
MRFPAFIISIGLALVLSGFSTEPQSDKAPGRKPRIKIAVDMVSLPVVVTDRAGRRITDLKKEDFEVFENGVRQEIAGFAATDEPVNVALMLDTSGSTEKKLGRIQNAAIDFVYRLHPDDEVAVISFAGDVTLQQDFTIDRRRNEYGIKKTRTGDSTVLYDAVWLALEEVLKPIQERKALVLFTDGVDYHSKSVSEHETMELAKETRATIYCVYYNTEPDQYNTWPGATGDPTRLPPVINPYPPAQRRTAPVTPQEFQLGRAYLNQLAEFSGGLVFDGMEDLGNAFDQVAKELANQYSIGYYSNNTKKDGKFRKVEIRMNKPGLVARTKKGYYPKKR